MIPRLPIELSPAFDDRDSIERLFDRLAPYSMLQARAQVMGSHLEQAAITGEPITEEMVEAASEGGTATLRLTPTFRGYWSTPDHVAEGVEPLVHHERFVDAARRLNGAEIVRPTEIYAHVIVPHRQAGAGAHVDLPAFRGVGRRELPVWLLVTMRRSGLFERWRIPVATAVCWLYDGPGGSFTYWPKGPDGPPVSTRRPFDNTAVVGENDSMFHRGDPVGDGGRLIPEGLTVESRLLPSDASGRTWVIRDADREIASYVREEVRFALSWSAQVFADTMAARMADDHEDDLDVSTVPEVFLHDLRRRGIPCPEPSDPHSDPRWIAVLGRTYRMVPKLDPAADSAAG
jgi:hypothetical protein